MPYRAGEWYFPDGTLVPILSEATSFYRNRGEGDDGTVNLMRTYENITSPTGLFCCKVPDADALDQVLCINIGEYYILL